MKSVDDMQQPFLYVFRITSAHFFRRTNTLLLHVQATAAVSFYIQLYHLEP